MELFCENKHLKLENEITLDFLKKASSHIFDRVLNTPLWYPV